MRSKIENKRHFTLTELMVVLVIIAIVLAIVVPAFNSMGAGNAVDAAARMVSAQLMMARSEAISRKAKVAVLLPAGNILHATTDTSTYRYQSFHAGLVTAAGSGYTLDGWIEGANWTFLPVKTIIHSVDTQVPALLTLPASGEEPYERSSVATLSTFASNGESVSDGAVPILNSQSNSNIRAVVFNKNGSCPKKYYITICEAVADDSGVTAPNYDNFRVLEVNQFTGKTRFIY